MNENKMTPQQTIKYMVLDVKACWDKTELPTDITGEQIDELYSVLVDNDEHWDAVEEVRYGQVETGLDCEYSRHYESKAVAAKAPNGQWVGWTYWYGGGKHAEPESVEWMEDAYFLTCQEEQKMVTIRTFSKQ